MMVLTWIFIFHFSITYILDIKFVQNRNKQYENINRITSYESSYIKSVLDLFFFPRPPVGGQWLVNV